jgi:hypothetical protein
MPKECNLQKSTYSLSNDSEGVFVIVTRPMKRFGFESIPGSPVQQIEGLSEKLLERKTGDDL